MGGTLQDPFLALSLRGVLNLRMQMNKREFCGKAAFSGVTGAKVTIYWCFDCGMEFGRIHSDLCVSKQPDLMLRSREPSSFLAISSDLELLAWSETPNQKAGQILGEKR